MKILKKIIHPAPGISSLWLMLILLAVGLESSAQKKPGSVEINSCSFDLHEQFLPEDRQNAEEWALTHTRALLAVAGMNMNLDNKNFWLGKSYQISNATAFTTVEINDNFLYAQRFIIYNPIFLDTLEKQSSSACRFVVLAHEISHHLYGDNLSRVVNYEQRREKEAEADSFAGYLCQRLSLTYDLKLADCIKVYESFPVKIETETHPAIAVRIAKFQAGWLGAAELQKKSCGDIGLSPAASDKVVLASLKKSNPKLLGLLEKQQPETGRLQAKTVEMPVDIDLSHPVEVVKLRSVEGVEPVVVNKGIIDISALVQARKATERAPQGMERDKKEAHPAAKQFGKSQAILANIQRPGIKMKPTGNKTINFSKAVPAITQKVIWKTYPNGTAYIDHIETVIP